MITVAVFPELQLDLPGVQHLPPSIACGGWQGSAGKEASAALGVCGMCAHVPECVYLPVLSI